MEGGELAASPRLTQHTDLSHAAVLGCLISGTEM